MTVAIFFLMSGMTHQLHIVKSKKTLKYFFLALKCLVCEASHSPPSVGKLKSARSITSAVPHAFGCDSQFVTEKNAWNVTYTLPHACV
jgi:hypothetical protein